MSNSTNERIMTNRISNGEKQRRKDEVVGKRDSNRERRVEKKNKTLTKGKVED